MSDYISLLLLEARRVARKAFLAFSANEEGSDLAQKGSPVSGSEEYNKRMDDDIYASKSVPVSSIP